MKKTMFLFILFFINCFTISSINASDLDVSIEVAKKEQKNVLVIFTLDNCKYCDFLKADLVNIKYIDSYVVCALDSRENKRLTGKMGIKKWPTSVVISVSKENQGEASRFVGYSDKADYEQWLKANAIFFGVEDDCHCDQDCICRKDGVCSCSKDKCNCCKCGCDKNCPCKKNGKCSCEKGKCKCKK